MDDKTIYYYDVELRDKDGNLYKTPDGKKLTYRTFQFTDTTIKEFIPLVCRKTAENYEAVCKEGTEVNIEVRTHSELTKTYPVMYSYYGKEKRFVTH
jgi:hypothetical protein